MQLEASKVVDVSIVNDTNDAYSKVEPVELAIAIAVEFDNMYVRSLDRYECNNGFVSSVIKDVVFANLCGVVEGASVVCVLMSSTVVEKFKLDFDLKDFDVG